MIRIDIKEGYVFQERGPEISLTRHINVKLKLGIHDIDMGHNMTGKNENWTRRDFIKIAGAAGVGAVVSPMEQFANAVYKTEFPTPQYVPARPFGKSGEN